MLYIFGVLFAYCFLFGQGFAKLPVYGGTNVTNGSSPIGGQHKPERTVIEFGRASLRSVWLGEAKDIIKGDLKEEESPDTGDASPIVDHSGVSPLYAQVLKDIDSILILIQNQARIKVDSNMSGEAQPVAELVLQGMGLLGLTNPTAMSPDEELIRSFLGEGSGAEAPKAPKAPKAPRESRPIQEWSVEDVDESPEGTEFVLKQVISLETLNKKRTALELLARPPPKFVHDVAILIQEKTGFMQAMSHEWPEQSRDARIELLQYIADSSSSCLGARIDFDPSDVLKGKEVGKTLRLLQLLSLASIKFSAQREKPMLDRPLSLQRKASKTRLDEMSPFLEAVSRCLKAVLELHARGDGPSPTREDPTFRAMQDRLEAEQQLRRRNEERLVQLQAEAQSLTQSLAQQHEELEQVTQAAVASAERKAKLQAEVQLSRQRLLEKASTLRNPKVENLKAEMDDVMSSAEHQKKEKISLQKTLQEMSQEQIEAETRREILQMEVQRMQASVAEAQGSSNEEVLLVQAEHEKLRMKIASLEEKMRQFSEEEDIERDQETQLLEEKQLVMRRSEDLQMQLQVILEESVRAIQRVLGFCILKFWNDIILYQTLYHAVTIACKQWHPSPSLCFCNVNPAWIDFLSGDAILVADDPGLTTMPVLSRCINPINIH